MKATDGTIGVGDARRGEMMKRKGGIGDGSNAASMRAEEMRELGIVCLLTTSTSYVDEHSVSGDCAMKCKQQVGDGPECEATLGAE